MTKFKIILLTGTLSLFGASAFAQYSKDAIKFSQPFTGGSSRVNAMGGAQTGLGGDISALSGNPAGLGLFTRSEFSFSPEFYSTSANANYLGEQSKESTSKAGINQLGLVIYSPAHKSKGSDLDKGFLSLNMGVGYNKVNNFNHAVYYQGKNAESSFADYLADITDLNYYGAGDPAGNSSFFDKGTLEKMAYQNYLIEYNPSGYFATTDVNNLQRNSIKNSGGQSEVNFGISGNFSNKVYIGASLGLTSINFKSDILYQEEGKNRTFPGQDPSHVNGSYKMTYNSYQDTKGTGVNAKLGMIYKASPEFRFGLVFTSPTWYTVTDQFSEKLNNSYKRSGTIDAANVYTYDYNLRTPYKAGAGISYIIGNMGLITADVEFVDYTSIHFSSGSNDIDRNVNQDISGSMKGNFNYKVGGEIKLDQFMLRAGYNFNASPYKNQDINTSVISGGIGYRAGDFSIDAVYRNIAYKNQSAPYQISEDFPDYPVTGPGPLASVKNQANHVAITLGLRF